MTEQQFGRIASMLRVYPKCCTGESTVVWYDSLKDYDYSEIYQAVQDYIMSNQYTPVPANIIALIPKAKGAEFKPQYDENGRLLIQCRRCRDTGLIAYTDKEGYITGQQGTASITGDGLAKRSMKSIAAKTATTARSSARTGTSLTGRTKTAGLEQSGSEGVHSMRCNARE